MKKIVFLLLLTGSMICGFGQRVKKPNPYKFAVGVGLYPGMNMPVAPTFKFYMKSGYSAEFYLYNWENSVRFTSLFTPNFPINEKGNLRFFAGPGLHVGVWKHMDKEAGSYSNPIIGGDGIIGLGYTFPELPLNFQVHYQPSVDFVGNNEFFAEPSQLGLAVRYAF